ncbi:MAG: hypothetical protein Q9157_009136, partial [Trypethelium eluteriae]
RGATSSTSNSGGRSASGSGVAPSFGRGSFYGGGASVPYSAGLRSPLGIAPFLLAGPALIGVAALSGAWLYGVYSYPYNQQITFNNVSAANSTYPNGVNQTHPVDCLCQQYSVCGCDDNTNSTYVDSLLGNGSYNGLNHSLVAVSNNGTIYINGTLPNGTTAAGGTSAAGHIVPSSTSGYLVLVAILGKDLRHNSSIWSEGFLQFSPRSWSSVSMAPEKLSAEVKKLNTIKEGSASILVPEGPQDVFYNPIQQFNRDLSVLAIRAFGEDRIARVASRPPGRNHRRKRPKNGRDHRSLNTVKSGPEGQGQITDEPPTKRQKVDSEDKAVTQEQDPPEVDQPEKPQDGSNESNHGHRRQNPISILDALSATGLRALRYAKELPFDTVVTANDMSKDATASIKQNIKHNGLEDRIAISTANAQAYMYTLAGNDDGTKYDVVDLDPYGTAVPFLDAAVQALKSGGLLCVTCTDAGIFASCGYPEKTYSLYGGLPIKGLHSHEGGLRLILHAISSSASRYGIAVEPLLSLSIDFYARLFVRVKQSPADVKFLAGRTMVVYNCDAGCGAWSTQYLARNSIYSNKNPNNIVWKHSFAQAPTSPPLCPHCGFKTHLSGPMFGGPLHNHAFIHRILDYLPSLN